MNLSGQRALVTGASSGIGKAIAIALGKAGADVAVNYVRGREGAEATADEIRRAGARAFTHQADVSSEAEVRGMFRRAITELGTIDILVNNAGMQRDAPFDSMTIEQVRGGKDRLHQLGPRSHPVGAARQLRGVEGRRQSDDEEPRAGSRTRAHPRQRHRAGRHPHRHQQTGLGTPQALGKLMALVPYRRIGEPEDVARAAVWLASDDSDYVVGTTLFVDGGMTLYPGFATGG